MLNLFFFEGNNPHLVVEMNFDDKVVIVGRSNNAGSGGGALDAEVIFFTSFSKKIRIFKILWSKFLLKMRF